jgi:hypothetical protein
MSRLWTLTLGCALVLAPCVQAAPSRERQRLLGTLLDPAFEPFVDVVIVGKAWDGMDPELLTDVTLQLIEGERVLQRSHRAFPAEHLFALAAEVAAAKQDEASLTRLERAAERAGRGEWKGQLDLARKLAGTPRSDEEHEVVPYADMTQEEYEVYYYCLQAIRTARMTGDAEQLERLRDRIPGVHVLQPRSVARLQELIAEAHGTSPAAGVPAKVATGRALQRVSAISRSCDMALGSGCFP